MAKALEQAARMNISMLLKRQRKCHFLYKREVNALHQLTLDYNNTMREHLTGLRKRED
jgi:hypothetical protein